MTIKLHEEFQYCRADQIAECSENCPEDLYKLLWNKGVELQEKQEQEFAKDCGYSNISEWKQQGNTPSDYMQSVNISKIWHLFTDEEKIKINYFAEIVKW